MTILIHLFPPFKAKKIYQRIPLSVRIERRAEYFAEDNPTVKKYCAVPNLTRIFWNLDQCLQQRSLESKFLLVALLHA